MKTLNLVQGTPEWHQHRATARNASDAPAMMGVSPYKTRQQLIEQRATGIVPEVDPATQARFDRGHQIEELARPFAEGVIDDDLYPVIGCSDDGYLSASFDGLTMDGATSWECKSQNAGKAMAVEVGDIPDADLWQCVQQLLVSGAEKLLYTLSDGSEEGTIHCWFTREQAEPYFAQLIAGWKQFDEDVANYVHEAPAVEVVGKAPETLPALRIEVTGMVSNSNLEAFRETAMAVFGAINTDLQSDEDFANAEKTVKWCKEVEDKLAAAKESALAQTADIDALFKAIDDISAEARTVRLNLDKQVKSQKEQRRADIQMNAAAEFNAHIEEINKTLGGKIRMPAIKTDFPGSMKGKRTIASLRDAASTELARAKIDASMVADKIRLNLETLRTEAAGHESLFADAQQLVLKENDDVKNVIALRIREHKDAEEKRLAAEREKIRAEEQAAAELRAQQELEEQERKKNEEQPAQAAAPTPVSIPDHSASAARQQPLSMPGSPAATQSKPAVVVGVPKRRPTDRQIIDALTTHFRVHDSKVIEWLMEMDLEAASAELASSM